MELSFYQVKSENLVSSAVKLLEKIYNSEKRCIFYSPLEERVQLVDKSLWTFAKMAFIPHGDKSSGFSEQQPIYFTSVVDNPNKAKVLMSVDSFEYQNWGNEFEKVIFIFADQVQESKAHELFEDLKKQGENVNYWKQNPRGWEKID